MTLIALKHQDLVDKRCLPSYTISNQERGCITTGYGKTGKHHDFQFKHYLRLNNL